VSRVIILPEELNLPAFLPINKCGCAFTNAAIRGTYWQYKVRQKRRREQYPDVIYTMWRAPLDRAESLYAWARKDKTLQWADFVEQLIDGPDSSDPHWQSQYQVACDLGNSLVPNYFIAWDFAAFMRLYNIPETPPAECSYDEWPRNSSARVNVKWRYSHIKAMRAKWPKDFIIWETIHG
jgi:hypothetical protein